MDRCKCRHFKESHVRGRGGCNATDRYIRMMKCSCVEYSPVDAQVPAAASRRVQPEPHIRAVSDSAIRFETGVCGDNSPMVKVFGVIDHTTVAEFVATLDTYAAMGWDVTLDLMGVERIDKVGLDAITRATTAASIHGGTITVMARPAETQH